MRRTIAFLLLILLAFPVFAADSPEDRALELRKQAAVALQAGSQTEAARELDRARLEALQVFDRYGRMNALRYVAEAYARAGEKAKSRSTFTEAMKVAMTVEPWYRRLSAAIGVVELQGGTQDYDGVRENARYALDGKLLEAVAASGEAGETRRFLTALDHALTAEDAVRILDHLRSVESAEYRMVAMTKLLALDMRPGLSGRVYEKLPVIPGIEEKPLWHAMFAKLAWLAGDKEKAEKWLSLAEGEIRLLKNNDNISKSVQKLKNKIDKK